MALAMARPYRHQKTGVYWLRKRVPDALRPIIGHAEVKQSLRTKDPIEAKARHAEVIAALEQRWANLRAQSQDLTEQEARELAAPAYGSFVTAHQDNPDGQTFWKPEIYPKLFKVREYVPLADDRLDAAYFDQLGMVKFCREKVAEILDRAGLAHVNETSQGRVIRAFAAAIQRASLDLNAGADAPQAPLHSRRIPGLTVNHAKPVHMASLIEGWAKERKPVAKTVYEYTRAVDELVEFAGHDDAARLSPKDLAAWKAHLIGRGLQPKTILATKVAPIRAILQWATDNGHIPENPAIRVTAGLKAKSAVPIRGFTDEEATTILRAAKTERNPVLQWVPLLAAYTGARLSELCQLRTKDINEISGIWCLRLVPEAGSLKTAESERLVPLHPVIIEAGFLDFVRCLPAGPIFRGLALDRFGNRGGTGSRVIGKWVRSLGLYDKRLLAFAFLASSVQDLVPSVLSPG
jgi:integrase